MTAENLFNLLGSIVALATVAVVLSSPQTARVISASGSAFTNAVKAASGR